MSCKANIWVLLPSACIKLSEPQSEHMRLEAAGNRSESGRKSPCHIHQSSFTWADNLLHIQTRNSPARSEQTAIHCGNMWTSAENSCQGTMERGVGSQGSERPMKCPAAWTSSVNTKVAMRNKTKRFVKVFKNYLTL